MKKLFFIFYLRLFGHKFFYRFNKALAITGLKGMGILNFESFGVSGEYHFLKTLSDKIKPKVIFDVGANAGAYSRMCSRLFPGAVIHAFEPHPLNFLKLQESPGSDNIKTHNIGFSNQPGQFELYDYADKDGSSHASMYEESLTRLSGMKSIRHMAQMSTIDNFMERHKIDLIDFLKIDTEGHEMNVLRGASDAIAHDKILVIQFEFGRPHLASRTFFRDIFDLLESKYDLYRLLPTSLLPVREYHYLFNEIFTFQNYVAILKSVLIDRLKVH
jgi:FkbM family methyltransferase